MKARPIDSAQVRAPLWRRVVNAVRGAPAAAVRFLAPPAKTSAGRRALLQGRFWKLLPPAEHPPLVTRYPRPSEDPTRRADVRSIAGISIEPVRSTDLGARPAARALPLFRPPGAINEAQFLAGCTRCGDCIAACPYEAIRKAPDRLGAAAGTPTIEADAAACWMCEDFPCITACEPGVLTRAILPIMGTARVTEHLCLAHHHTTCTVCSERCPVDGALVVVEGKPHVNESACTGCGVCRFVCPAPENAILLMPALSRPGLPNA